MRPVPEKPHLSSFFIFIQSCLLLLTTVFNYRTGPPFPFCVTVYTHRPKTNLWNDKWVFLYKYHIPSLPRIYALDPYYSLKPLIFFFYSVFPLFFKSHAQKPTKATYPSTLLQSWTPSLSVVHQQLSISALYLSRPLSPCVCNGGKLGWFGSHSSFFANEFKVCRFTSDPPLTLGCPSVFIFAMEVSWVDLRCTQLFIFG